MIETVMRSRNQAEFRKLALSLLDFLKNMKEQIAQPITSSKDVPKTRDQKDAIFRDLDAFVQTNLFALQANCNLIGGGYAAYQISKEADIEPELEIFECRNHVGDYYSSISEHLRSEGWECTTDTGEDRWGTTSDILPCDLFKKTGEKFTIKVIVVNSRVHNNILHYVNRREFSVERAVWSPFKVTTPEGAQSSGEVGVQMTHPDIIASIRAMSNTKMIILFPTRNVFYLDVERNMETGEFSASHTLTDRVLIKIMKYKSLGYNIEMFPTKGLNLNNLEFDMEQYKTRVRRFTESQQKPGQDMRNVMKSLFDLQEYYLESRDDGVTTDGLPSFMDFASVHSMYSEAFEALGNNEQLLAPYDIKKEDTEERNSDNKTARLLYSRPDLAVHGNNGIWDKLKAAASSAAAKAKELGNKVANSTIGQAVGAAAKAASSVLTNNAFHT